MHDLWADSLDDTSQIRHGRETLPESLHAGASAKTK